MNLSYKQLSDTKRGMALGMLVVLFDQTFHPLHIMDEGAVYKSCNTLDRSGG